MKKLIYLFIFIGLLFVVSCNDNPTPVDPVDPVKKITTFTVNMDKTEYELELNTEIEIKYSIVEDVKLSDFKATISYDEKVISLDIKDDVLKVKGLSVGKTTIFLQYSGCEEMYKINIEVTPIKELIKNVEFNDIPTKMMMKDSFKVEVNASTNVDMVIESSDDKLLSVNGDVITANKKGNVTITITLTNKDDQYVKTFDIEIDAPADNEAPVFNMTCDKDIKLTWGTTFNPLAGITAVDNLDGDITENIQVTNKVNNKLYGTYEVLYSVQDDAGNKTELKRTVEVVWDYAIKFIGHAGSFFGAQNSEESCIYALKNLQYQSLECDLKITKDNVFVCSHNDAFTGTDGTSYNIASYTLEQLQSKTFKEKRSGGSSLVGIENKTYEFKVMTLKRYLEICKEYNVIAIIELKGCNGISQSDQSKMQSLMDLIESVGMRDQVVFLASAYNCLIWTREHGYSDIPCQYLMSTCDSEEAYQRAVKYGFDISICVTYGNYTDKFTEAERKTYREDWIKRYQKAGCEVSVWTFTQYCDYKQVQEWIDFGVDWLTCDWQMMDKLDLSKVGKKQTHRVKFVDTNGTILKTIDVQNGKGAQAPTVTPPAGYEFDGWDKDTTNITSDLVVTVKYKEITYKINYDLNLYVKVNNESIYLTRADALAPTTGLTYTISSEFAVPNPTSTLTFKGWYLNKECTGDKVTSITKGNTGDITLYALWDNLSYTEYTSNITYILNDGINNTNNPATYVEGKTTTLSDPTKVGYDFLGWTLKEDSKDYIKSISDHTTGDITLYAKYELHTYMVTYNLGTDGKWNLNPVATGSPIGTTNVTAGAEIDFFSGTNYVTNVFLYYAPNITNAKFSRRIYAKHIAGNYYEFILAQNSGDTKYSGEYDLLIQVGEANSSEYKAIGEIASKLVAGDIICVEDKAGTAKTVTYYHKDQVSGLTVDNYITSYTVENYNIDLPVATSDGKTFVGWSLNSDLSNPFTKLPEGTIGDIVLYAVFN